MTIGLQGIQIVLIRVSLAKPMNTISSWIQINTRNSFNKYIEIPQTALEIRSFDIVYGKK